jgi:hypothetical protein
LPDHTAAIDRNDGKDFESAVSEALNAAGYRVEREQLVGHKKVDLIARQLRWGREWSVGVECKNYNRPLRVEDVRDIWSDYQALITARHIDEILIVTSKGLSPAAVAYVDERRELNAQDIKTLFNSVLDFRSYLTALVNGFHESPDGLARYYVPSLTSAGQDLEVLITTWIRMTGDEYLNADDAGLLTPDHPVAILGAYGIGKSSFATHLAAVLAERALADTSARIPILIRLGEVSGEQTLEGLLGKHFTATHQVVGYSFSAFHSLNVHGRFVIILDGFDEMKQLLSWREFRYNLYQLNRLHAGDSRLLILGRPTAFETDEEQRYALHGERQVRFGVIREPEWPDYEEVQLAPLTTDQMRTFLQQYLAYRGSDLAEDEGKWTELWYRVTSKHLRDIARRPVQLRMLAEILPSYGGDVEDLDLNRIYDIFIDQLIHDVIAREEKKHSRLAFSANERRDFLRRFAYWLWQYPISSVVTTDQIPEELIRPYAKDSDLEATRRDLVVGSPLDRRPGERVRFPHRSFQEFLVAEEMWSRLISGSLYLQAADGLLTDEVAAFMALQRGAKEAAAARSLIPELRGAFSWRLVNAVFMTAEVARAIHDKLERHQHPKSKETIAAWELMLMSIWSANRSDDPKAITVSQIMSAAKSDKEGELTLLCLFLVLSLGRSLGRAAVSNEILELLDALVMRRGSIERFTRRQLVGREWGPPTKTIAPIKDDFVRDVRKDASQVGRILGSARLVVTRNGRMQLNGGDYVDVRWFPWFVVDIAQRLGMSHGGKSIDFRGLRFIFAQALPRIAFITDWVEEDPALRTPYLLPSVELLDTLGFGMPKPPVIEQIASLISASRQAQGGH